MVRLILLYNSECWLIRKNQVKRLLVAEIRLYKHVRLDKIRNEVIKQKVGVAPIKDRCKKLELDGLDI